MSIIRINDGTEREIVVQQALPGFAYRWLAYSVMPRNYGYGTTAADAISDLMQILENYGDE